MAGKGVFVSRRSRTYVQRLGVAAIAAAAFVVVASSFGAGAGKRGPLVVRVSRDTTKAAGFQHATAVEPAIAAGARGVLVTVFQVGRSFRHGSAAIGWATSRDGGRHWKRGFFVPIMRNDAAPPKALDVTDPVVAYDTAHKLWVVASIADFANGSRTLQVHRSSDGLHWSAPTEVAKGIVDKDWITCDRGSRSAFRGRCYLTFTRENEDRLGVRWSADGGVTWSSEAKIMPTLGHPTGAFPVVQPNGRLVVLFREGGVDQRADAATAIPPWTFTATSSADGGRTFGVIRTLVTRVKPYFPHYVRAFATTIPSVGVDARGRLYAVWQTCRFRNPCSGNDLVLSTSTNGRSWTRPRRLPLGASGDRIVPGLAVAPGRRGQPVRLGLTYYTIRNGACSWVRCELAPYFASSKNGGRSWSKPLRLFAPTRYTWLAQAPAGQAFVGDYTTTAYLGKVAYAAFAVATRPTRSGLHHSIAVARIRPLDLPR